MTSAECKDKAEEVLKRINNSTGIQHRKALVSEAKAWIKLARVKKAS